MAGFRAKAFEMARSYGELERAVRLSTWRAGFWPPRGSRKPPEESISTGSFAESAHPAKFEPILETPAPVGPPKVEWRPVASVYSIGSTKLAGRS